MKTGNKTLICLLCAAAIFSGCNNSGKKNEEKNAVTEQKTETAAKPEIKKAFDPATVGEEPVFVIKTTKGDIKIKLYKETPLHRDNFVKLASERFYDGILLHRVIGGFMIQMGDPLTKDPSVPATKYGTGGPGYNIKAEILPQFKHKKGAVAAARKGDKTNPEKESSGSQFYIVQNAEVCSSLDGNYTIFGETLEGFDIIDSIANVKTNERDQPIEPIKIISILPEAE